MRNSFQVVSGATKKARWSIKCLFSSVHFCFSVSTAFPMLKGITCVTFDDGIKASQGLWLYNENVVVSDNACMSGTCGFFNSSAQSKLELAYFSNAFDNFDTFSVSFFFKRAVGASGEQSLLDNSECSDDGSMFVRSVSGTVLGSATNSTGDSVNVNYLVSTHCLQEVKVIAFA